MELLPCLGVALTIKKGEMVVDDYIPFVHFGTETAFIRGELFEVDEATLVQLDRMELPCGYKREKVSVKLIEGGDEVFEATVYTCHVTSKVIKRCYYEETGDFWHYVREVLSDEQRLEI